MRISWNLFQFVLWLILFILVLYLIYLLHTTGTIPIEEYKTIFRSLKGIDSAVWVALIAAAISLVGYFIPRYQEKKKLIEQQIRDQKLPIYEEFVEFVFSIFDAQKRGELEKRDPKDLQAFFWNFNKKAVLWLSDTTYKSYLDWKLAVNALADAPPEDENLRKKSLEAFGDLVLTFREDIGHNNINISSGDILSVIISDWYKYSNKSK
jgi:hypothetical protein